MDNGKDLVDMICSSYESPQDADEDEHFNFSAPVFHHLLPSCPPALVDWSGAVLSCRAHADCIKAASTITSNCRLSGLLDRQLQGSGPAERRDVRERRHSQVHKEPSSMSPSPLPTPFCHDVTMMIQSMAVVVCVLQGVWHRIRRVALHCHSRWVPPRRQLDASHACKILARLCTPTVDLHPIVATQTTLS